jgi:hypothetical protein
MDTNDSYTIVFTNEMLKSIGIDTENNSVEIEMTIENGSIKIARKEDVV